MTAIPAPVWDNYLYLTVDVVLFAHIGGVRHVLLIRRPTDSDAHPDCLALIGGYVDKDERIEHAAARELAEETGITVPIQWRLLGIYDDPDRDPRGRTVSVAYTALLPHAVTPVAGSDAADALWVPVLGLLGDRKSLAFDHHTILTDAVRLAHASVDTQR